MNALAFNILRIVTVAQLFVGPSAYAASLLFKIDSELSGTAATLAFDLVDGGTPSNSMTLSAFATDGTLGTFTATGGVSGTLPGALAFEDSSFFNEYLQDITLGSEFSFLLDYTDNAPASGSFPDAFSLFLLDPTGALPLVSTSDPTGANALFLLNLGIGNGLEIYSGQGYSVTAQPIPEPDSVVLLMAGMGLLGMGALFRNGMVRRFA